MKNPWTRAEKWLLAAPLLVLAFAIIARFRPQLTLPRFKTGSGWTTAPGTAIRSMALSSNGRILAAAGAIQGAKGWLPGSGTVYLWNAETGAQLTPIPPVYTRITKTHLNGWDIYALELSPDAKQIGFSRVGGPWELHDTKTQRLLWRFSSSADQAKYSPDGLLIALADYKMISIVSAKTGKLRAQWKLPDSTNDIDWSPDGTRLVQIGPYKEKDPIEIRRVRDGHLLHRIDSGGTHSVVFSPDGQSLLVAATQRLPTGTFDFNKLEFSSFQGVRCYDIATGQLKWGKRVSELGGNGSKNSKDARFAAFCDAAYSPDGRLVAAYQFLTGQVFLMDSSTGRVQLKLSVVPDLSNFFIPTGLRFSPNGQRLFVRGGEAVHVFDLTQDPPAIVN